jgi:transposase-like protein
MNRRNMSRNKHSATFKFKVALAAMKGDKTVAQLCQEYDLAASQIYTWKKELEERGVEVFETKSPERAKQAQLDSLHATIGRLKVENDFLARVLGKSP